MKSFVRWLVAAVCMCLVSAAWAQTNLVNDRVTYDVDLYFTPTDYPCLVEGIYLFGTGTYHLHVVLNPSGGYSYQEHVNVKQLTAIGMDTGVTYHYNVPLSYEVNGSTDELGTELPIEFTFHNIDHFVGSGQLQNLCIRTLWHVTVDRTTREVK